MRNGVLRYIAVDVVCTRERNGSKAIRILQGAEAYRLGYGALVEIGREIVRRLGTQSRSKTR
jgi:hypothetical protein